jgi:hypothetical protein
MNSHGIKVIFRFTSAAVGRFIVLLAAHLFWLCFVKLFMSLFVELRFAVEL